MSIPEAKKKEIYTKVVLRKPNMIQFLPKEDITEGLWLMAMLRDESLIKIAPKDIQVLYTRARAKNTSCYKNHN